MRSSAYGFAAILLVLGGAGCGFGGSDEPDESVDTDDDNKSDTALPREVAIDLEAGATKRVRVTIAAFVAKLTQTGSVPAKLTAIHKGLEIPSEISANPELLAADGGGVRTWTVRIENLGDERLRGTLRIDLPAAAGELGIVSDIDKTVMPPEVSGELVPPYPGIAALLRTFELRNGGSAGDVHYVTARTPDRIVGVAEWMEMHDVPEGSIDTGIGGSPFPAQREKVADITRLFEASPEQTFVLLGDTSHRDPEVYKEIRTKFPDRVAATFIHKVNVTVNPDRVMGMHLVNNYAEAAAKAFGDELLTETEARDIMKTAQSQGLAITDAEIDALIEAAN